MGGINWIAFQLVQDCGTDGSWFKDSGSWFKGKVQAMISGKGSERNSVREVP